MSSEVSKGSVLKEKLQSHVLVPFAAVCVQAEVSLGVMNAIRRSHHKRVERRRLQLIPFARYGFSFHTMPTLSWCDLRIAFMTPIDTSA